MNKRYRKAGKIYYAFGRNLALAKRRPTIRTVLSSAGPSG
jgi:hypothetical protein